MSTREEVLGRIRRAVEGAPEVPEAEIPRAYRTEVPCDDLAGLLAERVADYRAIVHVVPSARVAATLAGLVEGKRIAVPDGLPAEWAGPVSQAAATVLADPARDELDTVDAVLTGCAVAVAVTGTIVLDAGPGQGRRELTLVPDHHLCVVRAGQIVAGVPEAIARLSPDSPLTWISGPSATSDIELDRVEGVHGPRTLEVVIAV
ncbi:LutC/YkgG family protein [Planomonospora venezuelensis]|uniref:L-lactate dehydrogenase complex protein LldG n=1 Tax=Planomonospora venezuelensis TaxID=1999 RepID=A0A841DAR9_PLAVE|nr:LUD domain-containing protein [Planomonospora venezuelensis]MBB5967110.1 L-lactate dehydrogenase complex protein LldG [Planomonospora venezuelensis]